MSLGDVIARLAVSLSLDTAAFEKGSTIAEKRLAQTHKKLEGIGKKMTGIGAALSIGITAPLVAFAAGSIKAAQESAEAMGQVDAALKSMGDGAGRTKEQLAGLASGIMRKSLFDDDEILRKVTANLLTFGNVAGAQFDRAQQAAVDLAARMGTDLQSATIMVGKALNDPAKGLAALRRVGIQFTEQQADQIKKMAAVGNAAGAQKIMLAELERQFGGSAEAMRKADPGGAFKQSMNELQEVIGAKLLPVLVPLIEKITRAVEWFSDLPAPVQNAVLAFAAFAAVLGPILLVLGPMLPLLTALVPIIGAVGTALMFIAANPVILALAAVILGIYLAWKNWDKIEPIILAVWNAVKTWIVDKVVGGINLLLAPIRAVISVWKNWDQIKAILQGLYNAAKVWLQDKLVAALNFVLAPIRAVANAFKSLYDVVVGRSYIPDMVDEIGAQMRRLDEVMVKPAKAAAAKTAKAFSELREQTSALFGRLFPEAAALNTFRDEAATLEKAMKKGIITATQYRAALTELELEGVSFAPSAGLAALEEKLELPDFMKSAETFAESWTLAGRKVDAANVRIVKSFKDMAEATMGALQNLASAVKGGGFLDILGAVLGLGLQLGSIGLFGKKVAGNINKPAGFARGTNFAPGGLALVGERGPELVNLPRGSRVTPNNKMGGGNTYIVKGNLLTPDFWAQIQQGDMAAAQGGAVLAHTQTARSKKWALSK